MSKKALIVLADCIDARSGKRLAAGDEFNPPPTRAQAERLVKAGCLPREAIDAASDDVDLAAVARDQVNHDALFALSDNQVRDLATSEGAQFESDAGRADVIAAIRAHRADPTASTLRPHAVEMRTDEGEREARKADADARDTQAEAVAADKRTASGRVKAAK